MRSAGRRFIAIFFAVLMTLQLLPTDILPTFGGQNIVGQTVAEADIIPSATQDLNKLGAISTVQYDGAPVTVKWFGLDDEIPATADGITFRATWGGGNKAGIVTIVSPGVWSVKFPSVPKNVDVTFTVEGLNATKHQAYGFGAFEANTIAITSMYSMTVQQIWLGTETGERSAVSVVMTAVSGVENEESMGSYIARENNWLSEVANDSNGMSIDTRTVYMPRFNFNGQAFRDVKVLLTQDETIDCLTGTDTTAKPSGDGWVEDIKIVNTIKKTFGVQKFFTGGNDDRVTRFTARLHRVTNPIGVKNGDPQSTTSYLQSMIVEQVDGNWQTTYFTTPVSMGGVTTAAEATITVNGVNYAPYAYTVTETDIMRRNTANTAWEYRTHVFDYKVTGPTNRVFRIDNTLQPDTETEVRLRIVKEYDYKESGEEHTSTSNLQFRVYSVNTGATVIERDIYLNVAKGSTTGASGIERLPRWVNATEEYVYVVEEIAADGVKTTDSNFKFLVSSKSDFGETEKDVLTWTFTNEIDDGTIRVTKLWNDDATAEQIATRPHIILYLMRDGQYVMASNPKTTTTDKTKALAVSSRNAQYAYLRTESRIASWIIKGDLPRYDSKEREYVYSVYEEYDITQAEIDAGTYYNGYYATHNGLTVENTRVVSGTTSGSVTKTWNIQDGHVFDGYPSVTLKLYRESKSSSPVAAQTMISSLTTKEGQTVNSALADMKDVYGNPIVYDPSLYEYYIEEEIPADAKWKVSHQPRHPAYPDRIYINFSQTGDAETGGKYTYVGNVTITNQSTGSWSHQKKTLYIAKEWDVIPPEGTSQQAYFDSLKSTLQLKYAVKNDAGEITGWSTGDLVEGAYEALSGGNSSMDPTSKIITINGNSYIAINVPVYSQEGKKLYYVVEEQNVPQGFEVTYEYVTENYIRVTNAQEKYQISAKKLWDLTGDTLAGTDGAVDFESLFPVKLKLYRWIDGVNGSGEVVADSGDLSRDHFNSTGVGLYAQTTATNFGTFPRYAFVSVTDKKTGTSTMQHKEYRYKIVESISGGNKGYFVTSNQEITFKADGTGYTELTNTYDPTVGGFEIRIRKEINQQKSPPKSVIEVLGRDGEQVAVTSEDGTTTIGVFTKPLPETDTYGNKTGDTDTIKTLPRKDGEGDIPYTVREISIGGLKVDEIDNVVYWNGAYYEYRVTETKSQTGWDGSLEFTVTNRRINDMPREYDIVVNKEWDGIERKDWYDQPEVTFTLLRSDGKRYDSKTTDKDSTTPWQVTFEKVEYEDEHHNAYAYVIIEENPPDDSYPYVSKPIQIKRRTSEPKNLYAEGTLTNTPAEMKTIQVVKNWAEEGYDGDQRPNSVIVRFSFENGHRQVTLTKDDGWKGEIELPVRAGGETAAYVQYTISEYIPSEDPLNNGKTDNYVLKSVTYAGLTELTNNRMFTLQPSSADVPTVTLLNTLNQDVTVSGRKTWAGDSTNEGDVEKYRPDDITVTLRGTVGTKTVTPSITSKHIGKTTATDLNGKKLSKEDWAKDTWEWTFYNVTPRFALNSNTSKYEPVTYVWEETGFGTDDGSIVKGGYYTANPAVCNALTGAGSIKNTLDTVSVTGSKVWADDIYSWARPTGDIEVYLYRRVKNSGTAFSKVSPEVVEKATKDSSGNWTWTFKGLPKNASVSTQYEYGVVEKTSFTGYTKASVPDATTPMNATNTLLTGSITVTKNWIGVPEGETPPDVTFTVTGTTDGGKTIRNFGSHTMKSTDATPWVYKFDGLPVYDNSSGSAKQITYTVTESAPTNNYVYVVKNGTYYEKSDDRFQSSMLPSTGTRNVNMLMENMKTTPNIEYKGRKVWNDSAAPDKRQLFTENGVTRSYIKIYLEYKKPGATSYTRYGEETFYSTPENTAEINFTWPKPVPATIDGETVTWRFREQVPSYYTCASTAAVDGDSSTLAVTGGTLTNTIGELKGIGGKKEWDHGTLMNSEELVSKIRPKNLYITFTRKAEDKTITTVDTNKAFAVGEGGATSWLWEGLLDVNASSSPYISDENKVTELEMKGYVKTEDGMNVANKLKTFDLAIEKKWVEAPGDTTTSHSGLNLTLVAYTGTTMPAAPYTTALFTIPVTMTGSGSVWTRTINDLPLYDSSKVTISKGTTPKTEGEEAINYMLVEETVPGYTMSVTGSGTLSGTNIAKITVNNASDATIDSTVSVNIENKRDVSSFSVVKTWAGDTGEEDSRPISITVKLNQRKEKDGPIIETFTETVYQKKNEAGEYIGWDALTTIPFNVPKSYDGGTYYYDVEEDPIKGYVGVSKETANGFSLVNTLQRIQITVKKEWDDKKSATRPTSLFVKLYRQVGNDVSTRKQVGTTSLPLGPTAATQSLDTWEMAWNEAGMPQFYQADQAYTYIFVEDETKLLSTYTIERGTATANTAGEDGTLKNTLATRTISGEKTWANENIATSYTPGLDAVRPVELELTLYRYAANDPKGEDAAVPYIGTTPKSPVKVTVAAGTAKTKWSFENMPTYADAANKIAYVYLVRETKIDGYDISKTNGSAVDITNTLLPKSLKITKSWDDDGNRGTTSTRPADLKLDLTLNMTTGGLLANGGTHINGSPMTVTVTGGRNDDTWSKTLNNMPIYYQGKLITYQIVESNVPGGYMNGMDNKVSYPSYSPASLTLDGSTTELTVTNKLGTATYGFEKTWSESAMWSKLVAPYRPKTIKVQVWRSLDVKDIGAIEETASAKKYLDLIEYDVSSTGTGKISANLGNYPAEVGPGQPYYYWVVEEVPTGYEATYPNEEDPTSKTLAVANTLKTVDITLEKNWIGDELTRDYGGGNLTIHKRPTNGIGVTLTGMVGETKVYEEKHTIKPNTVEGNPNQWALTVEKMPLYAYDADGKAGLIQYSVKEDALLNYQVDIDDDGMDASATADKNGYKAVINNTWKPVTITAVKRFVGDEAMMDVIGVEPPRPTSLTIYLERYVNGERDGNFNPSITLNNIWDNQQEFEYKFGKLPVYDEFNNPYTYVANEASPPPSGYENVRNEPDPDEPGEHKLLVVNSMDGITVSGTKTWHDNMVNDDDDVPFRSAVTLTLKRYYTRGGREIGPETVGTYTIKADEVTQGKSQTYSFSGLDQYKDPNDKSTVYRYEITENDIPFYRPNIGTAITDPDTGDITIDVSNTMTTVDITVNKTWEDLQGSTRPEVSLTLYATTDGKTSIATAPFPLTKTWTSQETTENDTLSYTFTGLPKSMKDGTPIIYVIEEAPVPGYTLDGAPDRRVTVEGTTVNLVNKRVTGDMTIYKVWKEDNDDADQTRPTKVTATLSQTDSSDNTVTYPIEFVKTEDGWESEFVVKGLAEADSAGQAFKYSVVEDAVPGYSSVVKENLDTDGTLLGFTITNTLDPVTVTVEKEWLGDSQNTNLRPADQSLTLQLMRRPAKTKGDYTNIGTAEPKVASDVDGNIWTFEWELPSHYMATELYEYAVRETAVPRHYTNTTANDGLAIMSGGTKTSLSNTLETVTLSGSKTWVMPESSDYADFDSVIPANITVELWRKGAGAAETGFVADKTIGETENWEYSFDPLPAIDSGSTRYTYWVEESETMPGFRTTKTTDANGFEMSLVNTMLATTIHVSKSVWGDDGFNPEVVRPQTRVEVKLIGTWPSYNYRTDTPIEATGYMNRPDTVTDPWTVDFEGMPQYTADGEPITYKVEEKVPSGYAETGGYPKYRPENVTPASSNVPTDADIAIENQLESGSYPFTKKWERTKFEDEVGLPKTITIDLYRSTDSNDAGDDNAAFYVDEYTFNVPDDMTGFSEEIPGLQKVDTQSNLPYTYWAIEREVEGYKAQEPQDTMTVTNDLDTVSIKVTKNWEDTKSYYTDAENDNIRVFTRPNQIVLTLEAYTKTGGTVKPIFTRTYDDFTSLNAKADDPDVWELTLTGLPRYAYNDARNPELITYRIIETPMNAYKTTQPDDIVMDKKTKEFSATIDNELIVKDVRVTKEFLGDAPAIADNVKVRPDNITIRLHRDGDDFELIKTLPVHQNEVTVTFEWIFKDLPRYHPTTGVEYNYYVDEDPVPNYERTSGKGLALVNTLDGTSLTVTKEWVDYTYDGSSRPSIRPAYIDVKLTRRTEDGPDNVFQLTHRFEYAAGATQSYTFNGLAKKDGNKPYTYIVTEYGPDRMDADNAGVYGYTLTGGNVVENEDGSYSCTLTNTLQSVKITIDKKWIDGADLKQFRPSGLPIYLVGKVGDVTYYKGSTTATAADVLPDGDTWRVVFDNAPRYSPNGELIVYSVSEGSLGNYKLVDESAIVDALDDDLSNRDFTGSLTNKQQDAVLRVKKTWTDEAARDNGNGGTTMIFERPSKVLVTVVGTAGNGADAREAFRRENIAIDASHAESTADEWILELAGLPVMAQDGQGILRDVVYTVTEQKSNAYTTSVTPDEMTLTDDSGKFEFTISNELKVTDISVSKTFTGDDKIIDEKSGVYNPRPDQITFTLRRDKGTTPTSFMLYGTIDMVDGENVYEDALTFRNLPTHDWDGTAYRYYVTEETVNGYTLDRANSTDLHLVNKLDTVDVAGDKVWIDNLYLAQYRVRPASITIELTRRTKGADANDPDFTLTRTIDRSHTTQRQSWEFLGLPKYDSATGRLYEYYVRELDPAGNPGINGYTQVAPTGDVAGKTDLEIVNTVERADITAVKNWNDTIDTKQYRPASLELTLTGVGKNVNGDTVTYYREVLPATAPASGNDAIWTVTFKDAPKYDQNGDPIVYEISEDLATIPNYEQEAIDHPALDASGIDFSTASITNKQKMVAIRVTKNWKDEQTRDNGIGANTNVFLRPASIIVELQGTAGTGSSAREIFAEPIKVELSAEFSVYKGNDSIWSELVSGLPVQARDAAGDLRNVTYTVKEIVDSRFETVSTAPSRITPATSTSVDEDGNYVFTITNDPEVKDVTVTKTFTDDDEYIIDQKNGIYSPRPKDITVKLFRKGGDDDSKNPFMMVGTITMVDGQNEYTSELVFRDLPVTDWKGNTYTYYAVEETPNGYKRIDTTDVDLVNELQTVVVSGTKEWNDAVVGGKETIRPAFITIELTRTLPKGAVETWEGEPVNFVLTQQINRATGVDSQSWSFTNLPKFDKETGRAYQYFVRELDPDGNPSVNGYIEVVPTESVSNSTDVEITNTLDRVDIKVDAHWVDEDLEQYRPRTGLDITLTGTGHDANGAPVEYYSRTINVPQPNPDNTDTWSTVFTDVPRIGQDGNLITYKITETTPLNYELTNTTDPILALTGDEFSGSVTNTQKTVEIDVDKEWDDELTRDDDGTEVKLFTRPSDLTFTVIGHANGKEVYNTPLVMTGGATADHWTDTITNLPRYAYDEAWALHPVVYTIAEVGSVAYDTDPTTADVAFATEAVKSMLYEVKNTIVTVNVPVTKKFTEDDRIVSLIKDGTLDEQYSPRPDTLTVYLHRENGADSAGFEMKHTFDVNLDSSTYNYTFPDLPKYDWDGNEYNYFIEEESIFGYDEVTTDKNDKALENELQVVEISGTKVWDDDDRYGGYLVRPKYITIELTRRVKGSTTTDGFLLTQQIDYEYTDVPQTWSFKKLPKVEKTTGVEYEYLVRELDPKDSPEINGYTQTIVPNVSTAGADTVMTVTNTLKRIDITVSKKWLDGEELKDYRPLPADGLDITLVGMGHDADGNVVKYFDETQTAYPPTTGDDSVWSTEFKDLPQYGSDGVLIVYTIDEESLINYDMTKREHPQTNDAGVVSGGSFENTQKTVEIIINKEWDDELMRTHSGKDVVLFRRPDTLTFTVRGTANGKEVYNKEHVMDSSKTETVVDDMNWTLTVDNLPHYAYDANNVLHPVVWTVTEHGSDAYDTKTLVHTVTYGDDEDSKSILFENKIIVDDVTVTNEFIGDERMLERVRTGILRAEFSPRPADVTMYLHRRGGEDDAARPFEMEQVVEVNNTDPLYDYTFEDLPVCDWDGVAYEYYVSQDKVAGYEEISGETYDLELVNEFQPVDISGKKVWDDDANPNGEFLTRPDSITIELTRRIKNTTTVEAFMLEEEVDYDKSTSIQDWIFEAVPKYSKVLDARGNDQEYEYLIREIGPDIDEGVHAYSNEYEQSAATGDVDWTVTNTLKRIDIEVEKTWLDGEGLEDYRPTEDGLEVTLTGTGEGNVTYYKKTDVIMPPATGTSNVWTLKFSDLPLFDRNGDLVKYTVTEDLAIMYRMTDNPAIVTAEDARNKTFTAVLENTLKTETYSGKKTWVDEENKHKTRPETIEIALKREYIDPATRQKVIEDAGAKTVSSPWEWSFEGMPVYHKSGAEYTYYVEETSKDGRYEVTTTAGDRMSLTNTLITQDVVIKKNWEDSDNRYNTRPTTVNIVLTSSTKLAYRGAITSVRGWEFVFEGLPKYTQSGSLVNYTLSEDAVTDYEAKEIVSPTSSESATSYSGSITNALVTTEVAVTKVWSGGSDRPSVTIQLQENGRQIETVTLSSANNWTHTWQNLPKTRNGSAITYAVSEVSVKNYKTAIQSGTTAQGFSFTVTNTYTPPATTPPGTPGGATPTPRPGTSTSVPGGATVPPGATPAPDDPTKSRNNSYVTLLDLEVPLGYGSSLNLGECFD